MKTDDIQRMINDKGSMAQTLYYAMLSTIIEDYYDTYDSEYNKDILSTICYNVTIKLLDRIYNNQWDYEDKIYLNERSLERAGKDLITMTPIDYPDGIDANELNKIVEEITFNF